MVFNRSQRSSPWTLKERERGIPRDLNDASLVRPDPLVERLVAEAEVVAGLVDPVRVARVGQAHPGREHHLRLRGVIVIGLGVRGWGETSFLFA